MLWSFRPEKHLLLLGHRRHVHLLHLGLLLGHLVLPRPTRHSGLLATCSLWHIGCVHLLLGHMVLLRETLRGGTILLGNDGCGPLLWIGGCVQLLLLRYTGWGDRLLLLGHNLCKHLVLGHLAFVYFREIYLLL